MDVSNFTPGVDFKQFISNTRKIISEQPKNSLLTLFDATDSYFDNETISILKKFTASNKPYVKASAVIGIAGLKKMMLEIISKFSGRTFKQYRTREEAATWLIWQ